MKLHNSETRLIALRLAFAKLDGKHPFDGGGNIMRNDPYFASAMEREFGKTLAGLRKEVHEPIELDKGGLE